MTKASSFSRIGQGRDPLLGTFASQRNKPGYAVNQLKRHRTYNQTKHLLKQLKIYRVEQHLYDNKPAREWDAIFFLPTIGRSKDWVQELGWLAHGFCAAADKINSFLRQRKEFGKSYLLGRYEEANRILDKVADEFGYSFWLAERKLMLIQAGEGFEAHKEYLGGLQHQIQDALIGKCSERSQMRPYH